MSEKKVIGLTGTIGSGKSTALRILSEMIPATDCDMINRHLLEKGQKGYRELKKRGLLLALPDGSQDKTATAKKMFSDPVYKKEVEQILHPLILEEMKCWIQEQNETCVVEVPLLFELNLQDCFDSVWCITCSPETALSRTEKNRHLSREQQLARRKHQLEDEKKISLSDLVISNDGTMEELREKLESALKDLQMQN